MAQGIRIQYASRIHFTTGCSLRVAAVTWTWPMAKVCPAPGWHPPQVWARLAGFTVDRGSFEGKILWTPWQEAQLATVCEPERAARPWKLSAKVGTRSVGRL